MVLLGYEARTKGYRLVDPSTEKLHISRDVVFEEDGTWDWNNGDSNQLIETATETFTVEYQDIAAGPTIHELARSGDVGENSGGGDAQPLSPQSPATPATPQAQPQSASSAPTANGSPQQGSAEKFRGCATEVQVTD